MAINYTISYTFVPSTTISSSQVNTNFSDNANTWTGLEAKTKTFSNLGVDSTPTSATDVAIKSYVDKLNNYRHPVLQFSSTTAVNMETGINGTSGQAQILFPDGTLRTDSTASRINLNISQVAALSGTAQSGLRTGSVANNTWYACYAVKVTDSTTNFVMVADTVLPIQGSFASLNSNFGTNSWVYLGLIRYGNNADSATNIQRFVMSGDTTFFDNTCTKNSVGMTGMNLADTSSASSLSYNYVAGTGAAQIPTNITMAYVSLLFIPGGAGLVSYSSGSSGLLYRGTWTGTTLSSIYGPPCLVYILSGVTSAAPATSTIDINLVGWKDSVLGIGANPIL